MKCRGLSEFLSKNPLIDLLPATDENFIQISGSMFFNLALPGNKAVNERYDLLIKIPYAYPKEAPIFFETSNRIPKESSYHVNERDGSFCLGSPLRLRLSLAKLNNFSDFCDKFLNPYIYAVSLKIIHGESNWVFGELSHGNLGEKEDYEEIFGVQGKEAVLSCLLAVSKKKRNANKMLCPCGCKKKLGKCSLHNLINNIRYEAGRNYAHATLDRLADSGLLP